MLSCRNYFLQLFCFLRGVLRHPPRWSLVIGQKYKLLRIVPSGNIVVNKLRKRCYTLSKTVKFQMSLGEELNDYCIKEADRIGITKNAFIAVCVDSVRKQEESIRMTTEASDIFKAMKLEEDVVIDKND